MIKTYRYFLDNDEMHEGWNLVILDQDGNECTLFVSGDYGQYVARFYYERDFREAFLEFDKDYLLRKVAKADIYDGEITLKEIKHYILSLFKNGSWTREKARNEWDLLDDYEFDYKEQFNEWVKKTEIYDAWDLACYRYSAGAVAFAEQTLPRVKTLISKELQQKSA